MMHPMAAFTAGIALTAAAGAQIITNQQPVSGGGISRWSQLWQDPGPNGNDLDGDSVCWADFTLSAPASIDHIEWWGAGACELGFQIEFWRQDPGTIAYQPLGLFYYGGVHTVIPEARFRTNDQAALPGPGGITHYVLDLAAPVTLPANDASNPRWFIAIIGLTGRAYFTWNWAQGTGGSTRTFQFVRGDGHTFRSLGEGRALVLSQGSPQLCPGDFNGDYAATVQDIFDFLAAYFAASPAADVNGSGTTTVQDIFDFLSAYFSGCG
jgi:hypothetical protein